MAQITIAADGQYVLPTNSQHEATLSTMTVVMITRNDDNADCIFGKRDSQGFFIGYPNGVILTGDTITHGRGVVLMVNVSGIISNPVVIEYNPGLD